MTGADLGMLMDAPATTAETLGALAAIDRAMETIDADVNRIRGERAAHQAERAQVETTERAAALPAARGDVDARRQLATATARRRDLDDAVRHCSMALDELEQHRGEIATQRKTAERAHTAAERASLAAERLELAKALDKKCTALSEEIVEWRALHDRIYQLTTQLGEAPGRETHGILADVFARHFKPCAPLLFAQSEVDFTVASTRFTDEWKAPTPATILGTHDDEGNDEP